VLAIMLKIGVVVDYVYGPREDAEQDKSEARTGKHAKVEKVHRKYEDGENNEVFHPLLGSHCLNQTEPSILGALSNIDLFDLRVHYDSPFVSLNESVGCSAILYASTVIVKPRTACDTVMRLGES
jgi:hypothetical protein